MVEITATYDGNLYCTAQHTDSGATIRTNAPKDNQGDGNGFSPTDLVGTAMGTCMLTIMGIYARRQGFNIDGAKVRVIKEMSATPPRRIAKLTVEFTLPAAVPSDLRPRLEEAALSCPVHKSMHPDIEMPVSFRYVA